MRETTILVVTEADAAAYWRVALERLGFAAEVVSGGATAIPHLQSGGVSAVILNLGLSEYETIVLTIRENAPDVPLILSMRDPSQLPERVSPHKPAAAVLCFPPAPEDLEDAIQRAIACPSVPQSIDSREKSVRTKAFMGQSPGMAAIWSVLPRIAWADVPLLIQGETGSGKEVIAREVHANSQRAKKPFFKLNCAALPSELVESELFGYERGAFTGAFQRKPGIFELADGGTLLLDEIGDMDVRLQAKLLQVLQDHSFQRIGGKELITVDVRVIAATHQDLEKHIAAGRFREDLYYRLNVVNIVVPPLRERKEDLFELTRILLKKHLTHGDSIPSITAELRDTMLEWHWPGNVRELENLTRRLLVFRDCAYVTRELKTRSERSRRLQPSAENRTGASSPVGVFSTAGDQVSSPEVRALAAVDAASRQAAADTIVAALNATRWNRRQTAMLLKIDYKALLYKMKKLGIDGGTRLAFESESFVDLEAEANMKTAAAAACA